MRTTLPTTHARIFMSSNFRRPCGVPLYRTNTTNAANPTRTRITQKTGLIAYSPRLISNCVEIGNAAPSPMSSKISLNFGSMNTMKNRMIAKPTKQTING